MAIRLSAFILLRRWTTRKLMVLIALMAPALAGLNCDSHVPGWHFAVPGGHRIGVCRNDWEDRAHLRDGRRGGRTYQAGIWQSGGRGMMRVVLRFRDGGIGFYHGDRASVLW
jgi:hypothetical protein